MYLLTMPQFETATEKRDELEADLAIARQVHAIRLTRTFANPFR